MTLRITAHKADEGPFRFERKPRTWLTIRAAARKMAVPHAVVSKMVRTGRVRATNLAPEGETPRWRIPVKEIQRWTLGRTLAGIAQAKVERVPQKIPDGRRIRKINIEEMIHCMIIVKGWTWDEYRRAIGISNVQFYRILNRTQITADDFKLLAAPFGLTALQLLEKAYVLDRTLNRAMLYRFSARRDERMVSRLLPETVDHQDNGNK